MLFQAGLSKKYWADAVQTATYIQNRLPTTSFPGSTPYERWTGRKPMISHLRIFGCRAYIHIPKEQRRKLDYKARNMIFVGYIEGIKGYKVYDPGTGHVTHTRNAIFDERSLLAMPCAGEE